MARDLRLGRARARGRPPDRSPDRGRCRRRALLPALIATLDRGADQEALWLDALLFDSANAPELVPGHPRWPAAEAAPDGVGARTVATLREEGEGGAEKLKAGLTLLEAASGLHTWLEQLEDDWTRYLPRQYVGDHLAPIDLRYALPLLG